MGMFIIQGLVMKKQVHSNKSYMQRCQPSVGVLSVEQRQKTAAVPEPEGG